MEKKVLVRQSSSPGGKRHEDRNPICLDHHCLPAPATELCEMGGGSPLHTLFSQSTPCPILHLSVIAINLITHIPLSCSMSLCSSHSHSHTFQMCHNSFLPLPSLSLAQDWPLELLVQHASVTTLVVLQPAPYCPPPVPPLIHLLNCPQSILYATQI